MIIFSKRKRPAGRICELISATSPSFLLVFSRFSSFLPRAAALLYNQGLSTPPAHCFGHWLSTLRSIPALVFMNRCERGLLSCRAMDSTLWGLRHILRTQLEAGDFHGAVSSGCQLADTFIDYTIYVKLENNGLRFFLLFSDSVVSESLRPHGLQHTRLPCPSLSPRACSNSCPLRRWCHPTISSSVVPFSSCPQSFPASGSFLFKISELALLSIIVGPYSLSSNHNSVKSESEYY